MIRKLTMVILIVIITVSIGCSSEKTKENAGETPTSQPTAEIITEPVSTPAPEPLPAFDDFDSDYDNLVEKDSSIAVCNEKIYYTVNSNLFYINIASGEKVKLDKDLVIYEIYCHDGYIYYLKEKSFKRINVENNKMEWLFKAGEICRASIPETSGANQQLGYFYMTDTFVYILCTDIEKGAGDPSPGVVYSKIGEWKLSLEPPADEGEHIESDYWRIENKTEYVTISNTSLLNNSDRRIIIASYRVYIVDLKLPIDGGLVKSGDKVYFGNQWKSAPFILGYVFDTDERIFEQDIVDAYTKLFALNQYVFGYYYGNRENNIDKRGVLLIDTKNDIVYENEEINQVISGDIDYKNLYHTNYYYNGEALYVLEEEFDEVERKNIDGKINIYKAEVKEGKLHFTQIYKEFEREN